MFEGLDVPPDGERQPSLFNTLTEWPRTLFELNTLAFSMPVLAAAPRGDGHAVLLLPGFLADDRSLLLMRRWLQWLGYNTCSWELGRNSGRAEILQARLPARFEALSTSCGAPVTLIGQSLGGVYARELARSYPDAVRQVITLGSPIAIRHGRSMLSLVRRQFECQTGMTVERMRQLLEKMNPGTSSPPVPVTAIYSRGDGIVNWRSCREPVEDETTQNIEVYGSHCGMAVNPWVYTIIADRLAQPQDDWQRYKRAGSTRGGE